jgi:hypothetical protein
VFVATKVGQHVSINQLLSTQVGFITQLKGTLTKKRYTPATIFVDHYSKLKYIHLTKKKPLKKQWKPSVRLNTLPSSAASASSTATDVSCLERY